MTRSNSKASFMIEQFVHGYYHFENLNMDDLQLSDRAKSLLQVSPDKFRDEYGDYFILGYQRRFMFSALIECNTSNKQYTRKMEDDAKAVWQGTLGTGVGNTEEYTTSDFRFSGAARVFQSGCDFQITDSGPSGDGVAIKDVIKMVNGITKAPPKGRKEIALLRHYSELYHSLPNSAPVAPRIFDELHELDSMAWELEHSRLHPACNWKTLATINQALKTFTERRRSFIDDDASLKQSQGAFLDAKKLLDNRLLQYDFIQQVIEESRNGPVIGSTVKSSNPDQKWVYGLVPGTTPQTGTRGPTPAAPQFSSTYLTFTSFSANLTPDVLGDEAVLVSQVVVPYMEGCIVGWTLSCRSTARKKKAFTVKGGGLLENGLEIEVEPVRRHRVSGWEASTWRCRIYFVSKAMYNFGM
ncbi:hypothetical protein BJV74DRAFT_867453 [Russula compacta]|nr:hypothetical protein BJV74DRAFT_867453 [Russula compacta]